jgi:hypothetical protein
MVSIEFLCNDAWEAALALYWNRCQGTGPRGHTIFEGLGICVQFAWRFVPLVRFR